MSRDYIPVIKPGETPFDVIDLPDTVDVGGPALSPPEDEDEEHGGGGGEFLLPAPLRLTTPVDDVELNITPGIEDYDLSRTNPELVRAAKYMTQKLNNLGFELEITGGARSPEHNADTPGAASGSRHLTGNALDMWSDCPDGMLEEIAEEIGLDGFWHDAGTGMHFHLQNLYGEDYNMETSGIGERSAVNSLGRLAGMELNSVFDRRNAMDYEETGLEWQPEPEREVPNYSILDVAKLAVENAWDSASNTGFASMLQFGYANDIKADLTQHRALTEEDMEYIKALLPDDKEAQEWCIMHGVDAEAARFLANQKALDKKRQAEVQAFYANEKSKLAKGIVAVAGGVGYILDPLYLVPQLGAAKALSMATKLGKAAMFVNHAKLAWVAKNAIQGAMAGGELAAVQYLEDTMKNELGGQREDVGHNAAFAFMAGAGINFLTRAGAHLFSNEIKELDKLETKALEGVAGYLEEQSVGIGLRGIVGESGYKGIQSAVNKEIGKVGSELQKFSKTFGKTDAMAFLHEAAKNNIPIPDAILTKIRQQLHLASWKKSGKTNTKQLLKSNDEVLDWLKTEGVFKSSITIGRPGSETLPFIDKIADTEIFKTYKSGTAAKNGLREILQEGFGKDRGDHFYKNLQKHIEQEIEKEGTDFNKLSKTFNNKEAAAFLQEAARKGIPIPEQMLKTLRNKINILKMGKKKAEEMKTAEDILKWLKSDDIYKQVAAGDDNAYKILSNRFRLVNSEEATPIIREMTGAEIPLDAKSFYVADEDYFLLFKDRLAEEGKIGDAVKEALEKYGEIPTVGGREAYRKPIVYFNEDGTTTWNGVKLSRDNLFNTNTQDALYMLEKDVNAEAEKGWFMDKLPDFLKPYAQKAFREMEQGFFGAFYTSGSKTLRKVGLALFDDPRGRGDMIKNAISAESHKMMLSEQLTRKYFDFIDIRNDAIGRVNGAINKAKVMDWNRKVAQYYNAVYAGNKAGIAADVIESATDDIINAAKKLREYRDLQIDLGKRSGEIVGARGKNIVEKDWNPVDDELWRYTDESAQAKLLAMAKDEQELVDQLAHYAEAYAKRDKVKAQLEREQAKEIRKAKEAGKNPPVLPELTDEYIEKEIKARAKGWANDLTGRYSNVSTQLDKGAIEGAELGELPFFKERLPIDTTGIMKFKLGDKVFDFSFDNNLRSFDLDRIIRVNIDRFSGEAALKGVFGSKGSMESVLAQIEKELKKGEVMGAITHDDKKAMLRLKEAINELRGCRPREDTIGRLDALGRMFLNSSYAKNGGNMMWAQVGEVAGALAYGGIHHILDFFKPTKKFMENIRYGKANAETIREIEQAMYGCEMEQKIFGMAWNDMAVREALGQGSLIDKGLGWLNDTAMTAGKITSIVNRLPQMTENMTRAARGQAVADWIFVAYGETVGSKLRKPFSKAKLAAAHITEKDAKKIKDNIRKFSTREEGGKISEVAFDAWQREDPVSYAKFWEYCQQQGERMVTTGNRLGNRNIWKNTNVLTRMLLQFKDFNLRAINAQTLRTLTAGDIDDAISTGMSVITNTAMYGARCEAQAQALEAVGLQEQAKKYREMMFADDMILKAAATRSVVIGSPVSLGNDIYEIVNPNAMTVRTSAHNRPEKVQEGKRSAWDNDNYMETTLVRAINQSPAIKEATITQWQGALAAYHAGAGNATQRDLQNMINLVPFNKHVVTNAFYAKLVAESGLPKRRNSKKAGD